MPYIQRSPADSCRTVTNAARQLHRQRFKLYDDCRLSRDWTAGLLDDCQPTPNTVKQLGNP